MAKAQTVYVALLDEGVRVWRPAPAIRLEDDVYIILRPEDYDPAGERWQYPPGTLVECEVHHDRDGDHLRAVRQAALPAQTA